MHQATVQIALKLDYKEIPLPPKIVIQLEPGEFRFFRRIKYAQHQADPVSAVQLEMKYEGGNQLQIAMQLAGRLVFTPGGEFKFGGTKLIMVCTPLIEDIKFVLQQARIKEVAFPMAPKFLRGFLGDLINRRFIPNISKSLVFDLGHVLDETKNKINALPPIPLDLGRQQFLFHLAPNVDDAFHQLELSRDAVHLNFTLEFSPELKIEAVSISSLADNAAIIERNQNDGKTRWDIS
jgi:hypothetical protein